MDELCTVIRRRVATDLKGEGFSRRGGKFVGVTDKRNRIFAHGVEFR